MRGLSALLHLPRAALIGLVRAYRLLLSPWVGQSCRFAPTCSVYAIAALQRHGAVIGTGLAGWRILRCNPWCHGGCDEVPDNMPWDRAKASPSAHSAAGLFTGLLQRDSGFRAGRRDADDGRD
ncbi:MAG: membrane protein insertion efficiency factor YidD [Burkholderiaceae bacterium]|jgi:putative membrane protein insertion efficiency factor